MIPFTRPKRISLKNHPIYSENWVQDIIAADPSIPGLGELVLRDRERIKARAWRLDLLLQDPETYKRYEVELQLEATDETHIIRSIKYWDIERKRYPQYGHCAVIMAEDSRASVALNALVGREGETISGVGCIAEEGVLSCN
jgi:hypothetical protein